MMASADSLSGKCVSDGGMHASSSCSSGYPQIHQRHPLRQGKPYSTPCRLHQNESSHTASNAADDWSKLAVQAEMSIRVKAFDTVKELSEQLCTLRPNSARSWLLRYLAMKGLESEKDALKAILLEGISLCKGLQTCQQLEKAFAIEFASQPMVDPPPEVTCREDAQSFVGEWDEGGVFVYQAFCDDIADWALAHQRLGGSQFNPTRSTWIKPSFAWILYRSGYGQKHGQHRILKIKISHESMAHILSECKLVDTNKATRAKRGGDDTGSHGRVQWDPERDIMSADGKEPRMMLRRRAIQIAVAGRLSQYYVDSAISIEDVTDLAMQVCAAHRYKKKGTRAMDALVGFLPRERYYLPHCSEHHLVELGMLPGPAATALSQIGRGRAT